MGFFDIAWTSVINFYRPKSALLCNKILFYNNKLFLNNFLGLISSRWSTWLNILTGIYFFQICNK